MSLSIPSIFLFLLLHGAGPIPGPVPKLAPEAVERVVQEVLADPVYEDTLRSRSDASAALLRWLAQVIPRLFAWLLRSMRQLHEAAPAIFWLIFIGLAVVLVLLVLHIGWTISTAFRSPRVAAPAGEAERREKARRSGALLAEARAQAAAGQLREALHTLLLSVLTLVEERRLLRIASSWTHREILARLRVPTNARADLGELQSTVEGVWYGSAALTIDDFTRCEAAAGRVARRLVPEPLAEDHGT